MPVADDLEDLLQRERELIRAGRLEDLARLSAHKIALAQRLVAAPAGDAARIARLRRLGAENSELLDAAARGLRAALRQIGEARKLGEQNVYARDGRRTRIASLSGELRQRL